MSTLLPQDTDNNPIPALRMRSSGAHAISVTSSSARNSTSFDTETLVVSIYATVPIYLAFGDSTVTASSSDHYFPAGVYYDVAVGGDKVTQSTHIAAVRAENDGELYISEKV